MTQYAYLRGDSDWHPFSLLPQRELDRMLSDPQETYGITRFEDLKFLKDNPDMNYWEEGVAVILKVEVVVPKPVEIIKKWSVD